MGALAWYGARMNQTATLPTPTLKTPTVVVLRNRRDGRTQDHKDDGYSVISIQGRATQRPNIGRARIERALFEVVDVKTNDPLWVLAHRPKQAPAVQGDPIMRAPVWGDKRLEAGTKKYAAERASLNSAGESYAQAEVDKREADAKANAGALAEALGPAIASALKASS